MRVQERRGGSEQMLDEALMVPMLETIRRFGSSRLGSGPDRKQHTLVLMSGDGNNNGRHHSFAEIIQDALSEGMFVEVSTETKRKQNENKTETKREQNGNETETKREQRLLRLNALVTPRNSAAKRCPLWRHIHAACCFTLALAGSVVRAGGSWSLLDCILGGRGVRRGCW